MISRTLCVLACAIALLVSGCGAAADASEPATASPPAATASDDDDDDDDDDGAPAMRPGNKTPEPERTFVPGPSITPSAELLAWLEAHADTRVRLPVVVRFADAHRFRIAEAYVGASSGPRPDDALLLRLDDTALGISLHDRLAKLGEPGDEVLVLWLEGFWRPPPVSIHDDAAPPPWPFSLRVVGVLLREDELAQGDALPILLEEPGTAPSAPSGASR